ncbi:hypothetical protein M404DRAFT_995757 [Pisolithus tinctorius Marx 270]|uniref:Uncharacterized protein n=1 Tax=Pisolithus tinctorius Marx 270 TaxID=870435 RepID=A0A0C3JMW0_PISTI|nr:hypothetical protein M404DRAFT_995757 [Pisolithus tinctorius Marx 270]
MCGKGFPTYVLSALERCTPSRQMIIYEKALFLFSSPPKSTFFMESVACCFHYPHRYISVPHQAYTF